MVECIVLAECSAIQCVQFVIQCGVQCNFYYVVQSGSVLAGSSLPVCMAGTANGDPAEVVSRPLSPSHLPPPSVGDESGLDLTGRQGAKPTGKGMRSEAIDCCGPVIIAAARHSVGSAVEVQPRTRRPADGDGALLGPSTSSGLVVNICCPACRDGRESSWWSLKCRNGFGKYSACGGLAGEEVWRLGKARWPIGGPELGQWWPESALRWP